MNEEDTRTKILHAAGEAFAEKGYDATTVREICRKAAVNLAAVNYHFGDKERLYAATIRYAHQFKTRHTPLPEWPPDAAPEQKLYDFVLTSLRRMFAEQAPWQAQLMIREMLTPSGACKELVEDFIRPHFRQLLAILDELVDEPTTPCQRTQLGFSVIGQCMFYRINIPVIEMLVPKSERESHYQIEQLAEHISNVVLAAAGKERLFHPREPLSNASFSIREKQAK